MQKEFVTTIAIVGSGADRLLRRSGIDPRQFVIGVAQSSEIVDTKLGKVAVSYAQRADKDVTLHVAYLDCSDAPALLWRSSDNPVREVALNRRGIGSQQVRNFEIFVATTIFNAEEGGEEK